MSFSLDRELKLLVEDATTESFAEVFGRIFEDERKLQKQMTSKLKKLDARDEGDVDEADDADDKDKAAAKKKDIEQPAVVKPTSTEIIDADFESIVDQINTLRSGKSLKDKEVNTALTAYFNQLQPGERQALYVFLTSLSHIVSAGAAQKDVVDPADVNISISGKRRKDNKVTTVSKKVKRSPQQGEEKKDVTVPIVVGEAARNKALLLRRAKVLMRP